jgi:hypothetical protein
MRLINTLSDVLTERVQMERKLAELRPTWGRTREGLSELSAILKRSAGRQVPGARRPGYRLVRPPSVGGQRKELSWKPTSITSSWSLAPVGVGQSNAMAPSERRRCTTPSRVRGRPARTRDPRW